MRERSFIVSPSSLILHISNLSFRGVTQAMDRLRNKLVLFFTSSPADVGGRKGYGHRELLKGDPQLINSDEALRRRALLVGAG